MVRIPRTKEEFEKLGFFEKSNIKKQLLRSKYELFIKYLNPADLPKFYRVLHGDQYVRLHNMNTRTADTISTINVQLLEYLQRSPNPHWFKVLDEVAKEMSDDLYYSLNPWERPTSAASPNSDEDTVDEATGGDLPPASSPHRLGNSSPNTCKHGKMSSSLQTLSALVECDGDQNSSDPSVTETTVVPSLSDSSHSDACQRSPRSRYAEVSFPESLTKSQDLQTDSPSSGLDLSSLAASGVVTHKTPTVSIVTNFYDKVEISRFQVGSENNMAVLPRPAGAFESERRVLSLPTQASEEGVGDNDNTGPPPRYPSQSNRDELSARCFQSAEASLDPWDSPHATQPKTIRESPNSSNTGPSVFSLSLSSTSYSVPLPYEEGHETRAKTLVTDRSEYLEAQLAEAPRDDAGKGEDSINSTRNGKDLTQPTQVLSLQHQEEVVDVHQSTNQRQQHYSFSDSSVCSERFAAQAIVSSNTTFTPSCQTITLNRNVQTDTPRLQPLSQDHTFPPTTSVSYSDQPRLLHIVGESYTSEASDLVMDGESEGSSVNDEDVCSAGTHLEQKNVARICDQKNDVYNKGELTVHINMAKEDEKTTAKSSLLKCVMGEALKTTFIHIVNPRF